MFAPCMLEELLLVHYNSILIVKQNDLLYPFIQISIIAIKIKAMRYM